MNDNNSTDLSYEDMISAEKTATDNIPYVMKRSGIRVPFDIDRICNAVKKANNEMTRLRDKLTDSQIRLIATNIYKEALSASRDFSVEEIQDMVEDAIMLTGQTKLARAYITYRYKHNENRKNSTLDKKILSIVEGDNEEAKQENSNKNPIVLSVQRDYMAGEVSRHMTEDYFLPHDILDAHKDGRIHFHDTDYYAQHEHNCCLINLEDMLQNGTKISDIPIYKPKSFMTACTLATQIIAQVASVQYGGQTITLSHLAPFVDISRKKIKRRLTDEFNEQNIAITEDAIDKIAEHELIREIKAGCQTIQYQLITLQTTNGQAPFVTIFMYLNEVKDAQTKKDLATIIEIMLRQRKHGIDNGKGVCLTPAFPKLIYVLQDNNINEDSEYFYLTKLAAECTAARMVPDYISEKKMLELKNDVYPCMGCRSFLTPDRFTDKGLGNIANAKNYVEGQHKYYGRFNQGVVTLNLVDVACSSDRDENLFWQILDERLDLCHRALRCRHERLLGTLSDVAPILWQDGALARLQPGETIDKLLFNGYSTISLGYAGLAECVYYMKGVSHTSKDGEDFALRVMKALNEACTIWKNSENIDYSVYGTPLESTTYKFAKCLQQKFGHIPHVTDKNYITNSYHIHVTEPINAFDKLTKEAAFQALSPGGAISYVEIPDLKNNITAVLAIMRHIYNTIIYAELNSKSDYCEKCGYDGEIRIIKVDNKLAWQCPCCGNTDQNTMHVARRTCGYIGTQYWNQGRTQEIAERVLHVSLEQPAEKSDD